MHAYYWKEKEEEEEKRNTSVNYKMSIPITYCVNQSTDK